MMMFRSRNEWFAHELQNHRRKWVCQYCQHTPFLTSTSFSTHILSSHPAFLASTQIEAVILQSEEAVENLSAFACPLCDEWQETVVKRQRNQEERSNVLTDGETMEPYGTKKQFRRHLGRHMEQLALFALPKNDVDMDDDSSQGDEEEGYSDHEINPESLEDETQSPHVPERESDWQPTNGGIKESRTGLIRPLFRPEWIQGLPDVVSENPTHDKLKWAAGLTSLWKAVDQNEILTQPHLEAKQKLYDFTRTLYTRLRDVGALEERYGMAQSPESTDLDLSNPSLGQVQVEVNESTMYDEDENSIYQKPNLPLSVSGDQFNSSNNTTIFVEGLSKTATQDDLRSFFNSFGAVRLVTVSPETGFGVVNFVEHHAAKLAIEGAPRYFTNRNVRISWAAPYSGSVADAQGATPALPQQTEEKDLEKIVRPTKLAEEEDDKFSSFVVNSSGFVASKNDADLIEDFSENPSRRTTDLGSRLGTKRESLDGKSIASGTTFALNEEESIASSRVGPESAGRAYRAQFYESNEPMQERQNQGISTPQGSSSGQPTADNGKSKPLIGPGVPDAFNFFYRQTPDEKLMEALETQKDRIFLLRLEQDVIEFVKDSK